MTKKQQQQYNNKKKMVFVAVFCDQYDDSTKSGSYSQVRTALSVIANKHVDATVGKVVESLRFNRFA